MKQLIWEIFICCMFTYLLAPCFRGFNSWLAIFIALGLKQDRLSLWRGNGEKIKSWLLENREGIRHFERQPLKVMPSVTFLQL